MAEMQLTESLNFLLASQLLGECTRVVEWTLMKVMKRFDRGFGTLPFAALVAILLCPFARAADEWFQWRGPAGTGVADRATPPVTWSESENLRWKAPIPGLGHSSPIVADGKVFVTTAIPVGEKLKPTYSKAPGAHDNSPITQRHQFTLLCYDLAKGQLLWRRDLHEALPHEGGHFTTSLASASPVTNGDVVLAHFGSYGTYCVTVEGKLVWSKALGTMQTKHGHGEGSSPVLHNDTCVINWDHEGRSFIVALDIRTGEQRWKVERDEVTSWASPLVMKHQGQLQVIVCGTTRVRAYELQTGKVIWECGGLSANVVATPLGADGMVYVGSSYDTRSMMAIKLDGAAGDITDSPNVIWTRRLRTPYVPSPILYGNALYFLRHYQGILTRVDAKSGEEPTGPFRLGALRDIYASPVGAAKRIYVTDLDGVTQVIAHGEIPRTLAVNRLEDSFSASAAIVGSKLILRGNDFLYCLEEQQDK